jgi:sterol desaturase/sphingolipid hydroxylase (fatty acid hydroxylase superfamily)
LDLVVAAIPGFFATMGIEHALLRRRAEERGPTAGDYERRDTIASLSMGVGSFLVPLAMSKLVAPITPGRGRYARVAVGAVVGAAALTTVADVVARLSRDGVTEPGVVPEPGAAREVASGTASTGGGLAARDRRRARRRSRVTSAARTVSSSSSVVAVAGAIVTGSAAWTAQTSARAVWRRSGHRRDLGGGFLVTLGAIAVWDFVYYWNHRLMHESRWLWAIHVVHHSSERYNLSTALRQPVAEHFGSFLPYGLMAFAGVRPGIIETARGVNLLYQYWIHTELVDRLGPAEEVLNTASHHRVHHGSNPQYLDRNHGSILIVWDRFFGTFAREDERVVYGLTRNIDTFDPLRIATHEHFEMFADVARAETWRDRLSHVFRGPGWSYARRAEREAAQLTEATSKPASSMAARPSASATSPSTRTVFALRSTSTSSAAGSLANSVSMALRQWSQVMSGTR